jgi:hypothetical protein
MDLIGIPINTENSGSGSIQSLQVLKIKKDPPKSATANKFPEELKMTPQLVIEKIDWVIVFFRA